MAAFKAARLFLPLKVVEMKPDATVADILQAFTYLDKSTFLVILKSELPKYLAKAEDFSQDVDPLHWWNHIRLLQLEKSS